MASHDYLGGFDILLSKLTNTTCLVNNYFRGRAYILVYCLRWDITDFARHPNGTWFTYDQLHYKPQSKL